MVTIEAMDSEIYQLRKDKKVTFTDKLAMIGGTLGLFTGTSIISLVEICCLIHGVCKKLIMAKNQNQAQEIK